MKRLRTMAVVGALLAVVGAPLAYAAGLWFGLPVVGGLAYCAGTSLAGVPGTTPVCNTTAPAGPTTLTGQELIPSDLNPQGTQQAYPGPGTGTSGAQSGLLPLASAASGAYLLTNTGGISAAVTLTVPNGINNVILNATGTITDYTLLLPITPTDGQLVRFASNATLTTVRITSTQGAVAGTAVTVDTPTKVFSPLVPNVSTGLSVTSLTVVGFSYIYNLGNNRWFRVQ